MSNNIDDTSNLEKALNYSFINKGLLTESLTHSSYSYEKNLHYNYERLEFLGDAVVEMTVSEYILNSYPDFNEGTMSTLRAYVVNENSLSAIAESLGVGSYMYLGKGEEGGNLKKSILADIFEAMIAAIYMDGGYIEAKRVLISLLKNRIDEAVSYSAFIDAKSEVQKICQQLFNSPPEYILVSETGPDHSKEYVVETNMCGLSYGKGQGPSKKKAEKDAAAQALKNYYINKQK